VNGGESRGQADRPELCPPLRPKIEGNAEGEIAGVSKLKGPPDDFVEQNKSGEYSCGKRQMAT
jgi:hypothetical protein